MNVLTIGVALTVPEPWGSRLQERRAGYGDGLAWTVPTHITLLPPTQVAAGRAAEVDRHLRETAASHDAFEVVLRGTATFRPVTQTSFIVLAEGVDLCTALADAVRAGPLRRRLPFPYHPHVTIAVDLSDEQHNRAEADLADFTLSFAAIEIERYELAEHGVWEPVASFALRT